MPLRITVPSEGPAWWRLCLVNVDQWRERYERLLMLVAAETVGDAADVAIEPPGGRFQACVRFTSRSLPERTAVIKMHDEWMAAVFVMEPSIGIAMIDDYSVGDDEAKAYTTDRIRELVTVVDAYVRGEGSIQSRRTLLGRWQHRLRIRAGGREWVAR